MLFYLPFFLQPPSCVPSSQLSRCSPFWLIAFDGATALHNILENAQFLGMITITRSEVALSGRLILRDGLGAET